MSVDLKLVEWIKANHARLSRAQIIEQLKKDGHAEQDIIDSYDEVVQRSGKPMGLAGAGAKSMAATVILSIFIPGAGHMYTGAAGIGVLILVLYLLGWLLTVLTFGIGGIIGIPLMIAMWLWGLIGSIRRCEKINKGEL
jgi:TM2 domain-containing membrane protein YozV